MGDPPVVDFLIITALEEERDALLKRLLGYHQLDGSTEDVRVYYAATVRAVRPSGSVCTYSIILVCLSGMGRVQAASTASDAIRRWSPSYVLLVGIAGGLKAAGVNLGDILIAEQIADYESQKLTPKRTEIRWSAQPVDPRLLEVSRSILPGTWQADIQVPRPDGDGGVPKRHQGTVTTGDKVIAVNSLLESFQDQNWPKLIGVEMEAGGVALVAHQSAHRPGFFMIRCVSDQAGNKASKKVKAWRPYACDVAAAFAMALIRNGPVSPKIQPTSDDLAAEMPKLTFAELEVVTRYVIEQPAQSGVDYSLTEPGEKLKRNGLSTQTHDQLVLGLSKVQLVTQYVDHVAKIDIRFPERLKGGFLVAYNHLKAEGLEGDGLFDRLAAFACKNDHRPRYQAAGLAILTYLFEICDVFEK